MRLCTDDDALKIWLADRITFPCRWQTLSVPLRKLYSIGAAQKQTQSERKRWNYALPPPQNKCINRAYYDLLLSQISSCVKIIYYRQSVPNVVYFMLNPIRPQQTVNAEVSMKTSPDTAKSVSIWIQFHLYISRNGIISLISRIVMTQPRGHADQWCWWWSQASGTPIPNQVLKYVWISEIFVVIIIDFCLSLPPLSPFIDRDNVVRDKCTDAIELAPSTKHSPRPHRPSLLLLLLMTAIMIMSAEQCLSPPVFSLTD